MPNRILREGILTSERVNNLGTNAELFYRRLMSVVDDFGRFTADPRLLRVNCYPLKVDVMREADISRLLAEVQEAGLIALYAVDGKTYLELLEFRQQTRALKSKYPPPPDKQTPPKAVVCAASAAQTHSIRTPYSETETETKIKLTTKAHAPEKAFPKREGKRLSLPQRGIAERIEKALENQWINDAGKWINRIKTDYSKSERVIAEVESAKKEKRINTTPAQYAEQIWKEFK